MKKLLALGTALLFMHCLPLYRMQQKSEGGLTPVTLNEVAHSIFTLPSTRRSNWGILRKRASI